MVATGKPGPTSSNPRTLLAPCPTAPALPSLSLRCPRRPFRRSWCRRTLCKPLPPLPFYGFDAMTRGAPRKVGISEEDVSLLLQRFLPRSSPSVLVVVSMLSFACFRVSCWWVRWRTFVARLIGLCLLVGVRRIYFLVRSREYGSLWVWRKKRKTPIFLWRETGTLCSQQRTWAFLGCLIFMWIFGYLFLGFLEI